jgi:hypothetical protein|tara:strand:- start:1012 stop:1698 length:687 start_codon:yes stop_codon:yes gene_type:complete
MATSGTSNFVMDFTEIAEEAWERAGREMRSGYDLRTARRSFNLLTIEWQNRGINLWTVEEGSIPLLEGVSNYSLPADTIDLLEQSVRTNAGSVSQQSDLSITRIGVGIYSTIPNKLTQGRPIQVYVNRQGAAPEINVWPVPSDGSYTFIYWRMRRIQDAGTGVNTPDMPFRFYPALVAGLAYNIATKVPELGQRLSILKDQYEEQFRLAAEEDREKVPFRAVPNMRMR